MDLMGKMPKYDPIQLIFPGLLNGLYASNISEVQNDSHRNHGY